MLRTLLVLALIAPLSGCWFVFIPGSAISAVGDSLAGYEGQHCVAENAKIGDKIRHPNGTFWTVKKLEGYSGRCANQFAPVRALVVYES